MVKLRVELKLTDQMEESVHGELVVWDLTNTASCTLQADGGSILETFTQLLLQLTQRIQQEALQPIRVHLDAAQDLLRDLVHGRGY